jgi:hypothetical protein
VQIYSRVAVLQVVLIARAKYFFCGPSFAYRMVENVASSRTLNTPSAQTLRIM